MQASRESADNIQNFTNKDNQEKELLEHNKETVPVGESHFAAPLKMLLKMKCRTCARTGRSTSFASHNTRAGPSTWSSECMLYFAGKPPAVLTTFTWRMQLVLNQAQNVQESR